MIKMGLNKFCPKCDSIIGYRDKYCTDCQAEIDRKSKERFERYLRVRKATGQDKVAYKKYRDKRNDTEYQDFYNSKEWKSKREKILSKFKYIDIYSYYKYKEIVTSDLVHHIKEIKEDFNMKLCDDNLIAVSNKSHSEIHKRMNESNKEKEIVIRELREMVERWEKEMGL